MIIKGTYKQGLENLNDRSLKGFYSLEMHFFKGLFLVLNALTFFAPGYLQAGSESLSVLTMNLHGYHPTDEETRYQEDRQGNLVKAPSHLHYFSLEELQRGHQKRIRILAEEIERLSPDILFLQEVGGGHPLKPKDCSHFHSTFAFFPWANTAFQLKESLLSFPSLYRLFSACRGNKGWITSGKTFLDSQIVTIKDGKKTVVHPFGANPYPQGVLLEGLAVLVKESSSLKVLDHLQWNLEINEKGDHFFVQVLSLGLPGGWILVANIHGGHKITHFEQAVALRERLSRYVQEVEFTARTAGGLKGFLIAGDFNASLGEISMIPWESKSISGQDQIRKLPDLLMEFNHDFTYKPWANILDRWESERRIKRAVERFSSWQKTYGKGTQKKHLFLKEALEVAVAGKLCRPYSFSSTCFSKFSKERIDFIWTSEGLVPQNAFIIHSENNWEDLNRTTSDHPGLYAELIFMDE